MTVTKTAMAKVATIRHDYMKQMASALTVAAVRIGTLKFDLSAAIVNATTSVKMSMPLATFSLD